VSGHRHHSLAARLILVQVVTLAMLWSVVIALTIFSMYQRGAGDIDVELRAMANNIARLASAGDRGVVAEFIADEIQSGSPESSDPPLHRDEVAYQIWTARGQLLARSNEQPALPALPPGTAFDGLDSTLAGWYAQSGWNRDRTLFVIAAKRVSYYQRRVRSTVGELAGLWLILAVLSAAAFWWSFRIVIRPLRELARQVAARSADDLTVVEVSGAFVEIQPLLAALNQKLTRIRELLESERRFFADAAHELRTPLAVIGAQAHVLAHQPDSAQRMLALRQIEAGIERGARVISKLLVLGKLAGAESNLRQTRQDLAVIVAATVDMHGARAALRGQSLRFSGQAQITCRCDAEQVKVMIDNLVENAIQYCQEGSAIEVSVTGDAEVGVISVADDGPGITPADRERAFARFERLGNAATPGSGLGLDIVRRIASLHEGTVRITDGLGGKGTRVEVRILR
jgi:signal transduction histidine kinase